MIKNWLDGEGQQLIETLTKEEQDACNDEDSPFETLNKNFEPQCNETVAVPQIGLPFK